MLHRSNELAPAMCPVRWVTSLRGGLLACPPGASWFLGCFSQSSRSKRIDKTPNSINEDGQGDEIKVYMTGKEMAGFLRTVTEAPQEAPVQMLKLWLIHYWKGTSTGTGVTWY